MNTANHTKHIAKTLIEIRNYQKAKPQMKMSFNFFRWHSPFAKHHDNQRMVSREKSKSVSFAASGGGFGGIWPLKKAVQAKWYYLWWWWWSCIIRNMFAYAHSLDSVIWKTGETTRSSKENQVKVLYGFDSFSFLKETEMHWSTKKEIAEQNLKLVSFFGFDENDNC